MRTVTIGGHEYSAHWAALTTIIYAEAFRDPKVPGSGDAAVDVSDAINKTLSGPIPAMTSMKLAWAEIKTVKPNTPDFEQWVKDNPNAFEDAELTKQEGWAWEVIMEATSCLFPGLEATLLEAASSEASAAAD